MQTVTYQLTSADLLAAYRLNASYALRRPSVWVRIALVGVTFASVAAWSLGEDLGMTFSALVGVSYWFLLFGALFLVGRLTLPRRVGRIFRQQKALHGDTTLEWSEESFGFRTSRGTSCYPWSDFMRIMEDKHTIVLMQSDVYFNFVPKRFLSAEQAASITEHAKDCK